MDNGKDKNLLQLRDKAREKILDTLKWYDKELRFFTDWCLDLDYFSINEDEAHKELLNVGMLHAQKILIEYEEYNYGQVSTNLTDVTELYIALFHIVAEELFNELQTVRDYFDVPFTDEIRKEIIEELINL